MAVFFKTFAFLLSIPIFSSQRLEDLSMEFSQEIPRNMDLELLSLGENEMPDLGDNCKELLQKFSESASAFTLCANQYAKPTFMCRKCKKDYIDVRTFYYALEHSANEGINCKDILTSRDKVKIIQATYDYIAGPTGLWAKASCSSCYTRPLNYSSKLTDLTHNFFVLALTVEDCFKAHPNKSLDTEERSEACEACQVDYRAMNTFYRENIFSNFPYLNGICFDILDLMNMTQRHWGTEHFGCGKRLKASVPLVFAAACILLTPVVFYITARYYQDPQGERNVSQPRVTDLLTQASQQHLESSREERDNTDARSSNSSNSVNFLCDPGSSSSFGDPGSSDKAVFTIGGHSPRTFCTSSDDE